MFRQGFSKRLNTIYDRLGAEMEYHSPTGVVTTITALDQNEPEFTPDGFLSTIQENETIYYVRVSELSNPRVGAMIVDEGKRFEIIRPELRDRFEWILIVRETIADTGRC